MATHPRAIIQKGASNEKQITDGLFHYFFDVHQGFFAQIFITYGATTYLPIYQEKVFLMNG